MFFERIHNIFNWGDKLTRYNGETITYDEIGNPLSYRDGMEMTWLNGRKLTTLQSGNDSISYKYDSNGVITSKTVNGVEYTYEYLNGHLMHETRGEKVFDYCYDANGQLYAVSYKANSSTDAVTYYYAHNWRGDITSIYDGDGNMVAKYEYDVWGNVLTVTNSNNSEITDPNHIANLNPFRYRSYYYDSESGLYYLMSRYYDPVTHRFLNADGYFQSGNGILDTNMNAYCRNNPIMNSDPAGEYVTYSGILYNGKTFSHVPSFQLGSLGDNIRAHWIDSEFIISHKIAPPPVPIINFSGTSLNLYTYAKSSLSTPTQYTYYEKIIKGGTFAHNTVGIMDFSYSLADQERFSIALSVTVFNTTLTAERFSDGMGSGISWELSTTSGANSSAIGIEGYSTYTDQLLAVAVGTVIALCPESVPAIASFLVDYFGSQRAGAF